MSAEAGMQAWLSSRVETWQQLTPRLEALERTRDHSASEALQAIELYRSLGRDLSIARRLLPGSRVTKALERSYAKLHSIIYRKPHDWRARTLMLFREEIPEVVHELRGAIFWVTLLFALSAGAGWWLVSSYPELISLLASEEMINGVENGRLWTEGMLRAVNTYLIEFSANNKFATLLLAILHAESGRLSYVNAGHNPGLLLRADGTTTLDAAAVPLGLLPVAVFPERTVDIGPGDLLCLYSDGVTEAASHSGEELGMERLEALLRRHRTRPLAEVRLGLDTEVRELTRGLPQGDDQTVLLVRRV